MDSKKQKALEAAGWRFADAADFLQMSDEERQLLDARVEAALAVRSQRQALKLSQKQLAGRINTSQPRIAKIERAAADVSLDRTRSCVRLPPRAAASRSSDLAETRSQARKSRYSWCQLISDPGAPFTSLLTPPHFLK